MHGMKNLCDVSRVRVWGCSIQNLVYTTQNIKDYELIPGTANTFILTKFLYILEFWHFKHSSLGSVIPKLMCWAYIPLFPKKKKKKLPESSNPPVLKHVGM